MIGQHIYSRCLEGYFSKNTMNADSTTVTISASMFARREHAEKAARMCEKIGALEDMRPVPAGLQGPYRGILKIRNLNREISVVCRSYRLRSEENPENGFSGSGEFREFTFSSSFLLSGEDKEKFFENPQYFLNLQDFEPYPSVMKRIQEARARTGRGKIEANPEYALFRSPCREMDLEVFRKVGFTEQLFAEYICSVLERVAYAPHSGHEKRKVLVILPSRFNPLWESSGGNVFAEEVLAATYKILPKFVRSHLNATTGGWDNPKAFVLEDYQLVFMEKGKLEEWKSADYSIIDLGRQKSYVTDGLDLSYGKFLWEHLYQEDVRTDFENKYVELFGKERVESGDNYPEKLAYILKICQEEATGFADAKMRVRYLRELIQFSGDTWTERATDLVWTALQRECQEPGYHGGLETELLALFKADFCPECLKEFLVEILVGNILHGTARPETVQYFYDVVAWNLPLVEKYIKKVNRKVWEEDSEEWRLKESLYHFYLGVCRNEQIPSDSEPKSRILDIVSRWHKEFLSTGEWEKCAEIMETLAAQLKHKELSEQHRGDFYQDLLLLLFYGNETVRQQAFELVKTEARKFLSEQHFAVLFWECLKEELQKDSIKLNHEILWCLTFFAILHDKDFLETEWNTVYQNLVSRLAAVSADELFKRMPEMFCSWTAGAEDEKKKKLSCMALFITIIVSLKNGYPQDLEEIRTFIQVLEKAGMQREASEMFYYFYGCQPNKEELSARLNQSERWRVRLIWRMENPNREFSETGLPEVSLERKELLYILKGFEWRDEREWNTLVRLYFELLRHEVEKPFSSDENSLQIWCRIYKKELQEIQFILGEQKLIQDLNSLFLKELSQINPGELQELGMEDVKFLKEAGVSSLSESWKCLDVLYEIYEINATCISEDFAEIREKIIKETAFFAKNVYLHALEIRRNKLLTDDKEQAVNGELIYNIVLLEEQITGRISRAKNCRIPQMAEKVFGLGCSDYHVLYTGLQLLQVIGRYDEFDNFGEYDCGTLRAGIRNHILETARANKELFCDKKILQSYKRLNKEDQELLQGMGLYHCLKHISKEWQEGYGIGKSSEKERSPLPWILAGVFALLGIGIEILICLLYEKIGMGPALVTAFVLVGIGVIGNLISVILVLVSDKTKLVNCLLVVCSILAVTGSGVSASVCLMRKADVKAYKKQVDEQKKEKINAEQTVNGLKEQESKLIKTAEEAKRKAEEKAKRKAEEEAKHGIEGLEELKKKINPLISDREEDWSIYVKDLSANTYFALNNEKIPAGNLFHLYTMGTPYYQYNAGRRDGVEDVKDFMPQVLNGDADARRQMIMQLDGTGNYDAGKQQIGDYITEEGFEDTCFADDFNNCDTSVRDCGNYMKKLYNQPSNSLWAPGVVEMLKNSGTEKIISPGNWETSETANLSAEFSYPKEDGTTAWAVHDAAIIYSGEGQKDYIICVMTTNVADPGSVKTLIREEISNAVYDYFNGNTDQENTEHGTAEPQ